LIDNGAFSAIGVDYSQKIIKHCKNKYGGIKNLYFQQGDALSIDFDVDCFDLVTSIHTMEHLIDDDFFLKKIWKWIKQNGTLVLEVPLLMRFPFKDANEPLNDFHIREYISEDLMFLFSKYFTIKEAFGVSRGYYTSVNKARNAILLVGEKKK